MDCRIETGQTKAGDELTLVAESLKTSLGEDVLFLLQIEGEEKTAKTLEKECMGIIDHALKETEGDAETRLDGTLKEINGLFKGLLISGSITDIHAILAIVSDEDVVYVSHAGRAEAYIIRGGTASQITEATKGKATPAFVHIASGPLEEQDSLVFSSQRLLRTVTAAQLATLASKGDQLLDEVRLELEAEKEKAALALLEVGKGKKAAVKKTKKKEAEEVEESEEVDDAEDVSSDSSVSSESLGSSRKRVPPRRRKRGGGLSLGGLAGSLSGAFSGLTSSSLFSSLKEVPGSLLSDLKDPKRRRKAHMLILAGVLVVFLLVWATTKLMVSTQSSQSKQELKTLIEQVDTDIQAAENRYLTGDTESANAMLTRAELQAKQVLGNESGLYREESLSLLDRIRTKREEINNVLRLSPRVLVSLEAGYPDILAQGLIGISDGNLIVYDKQKLYPIVLNSVESEKVLSEDKTIVRGVNFERMQTQVFQMKDGSITELINDIPTSMKTDDPAGWIAATAMRTYLRFLYVLSPENNQIYKYERLSNRYGPPGEYNVNGDLDGAIDLAIDGNIFVLKNTGDIVKLLRGEVQPFTIQHLPDDGLTGATRVFKVFDGHLYILDPEGSRVVVVTDGGSTGESAYVRQIVLEGEQLGTLTDLYVDPEELRLFVSDEKRVYVVDLESR